MPFYLSEYVGSGTKQDPFIPVGSDQPGWSAIDLRPDGGGLNACLLHVPVAFNDPLARFLADDKLESLTNPQKNFLQNKLNVDLSSPTLLRDIVATIMTNPPTNGWKAITPGLLRWEVHLGGLLWEAPRASGGAQMTDDFNRATFTGGPISWNNLASNWVEVGSATITPSLISTDSHARAETTPIGANQYAQVNISNISGGSAGGGAGFGILLRIVAASENNMYRFVILQSGTANNVEYAKFVSGAYSNLGNRTSATFADGAVFRVEANGSTLSVFLDGVLQSPSVTDTSHATGQPGIAYSSTITSGNLDNFDGGDLVAAFDSQATRMDAHAGHFGPF